MDLYGLEVINNNLGITVVKITVKCDCGSIITETVAMKTKQLKYIVRCEDCHNWIAIELLDYGGGVVRASIVERKEENEMDEEKTYEVREDAVKYENIEGESQYDTVYNPSHYASTSVECIDIMIETQGIEAVRDFCLCNAFKYLWRHNLKNGNEDVKKATWYLNKYLELTESNS